MVSFSSSTLLIVICLVAWLKLLKGCVIRLEIMKHKISVDPTERKIITIKLILKEFNDSKTIFLGSLITTVQLYGWIFSYDTRNSFM